MTVLVRSSGRRPTMCNENPELSIVHILIETDRGVHEMSVETLSPSNALDGGVFESLEGYLEATDSRPRRMVGKGGSWAN